MRIDDISSTRRFVARVSASVDSGDDQPSQKAFWPPTNATFVSVLAVSFEATPPEPPPPTPTPHLEALVGAAALGPHLTGTRRRTAAAAHAAQPAVDYGFGPSRVPPLSSSRVDPPTRLPLPRPPLAVALGLPRPPTPVPTVPIPSDRGRAELLSAPPVGLSIPPGSLSSPTADLDSHGAAAKLHSCDSAARYSHTDWENEQHTEPACYAAIQCILLDRPTALSTEERPSFSEIREAP